MVNRWLISRYFEYKFLALIDFFNKESNLTSNMQKYTVYLDKNNYFSVDSRIIELDKEVVRIVNLRSIKGFIGESFDLNDSKLKDIIMKYLRFSNNVELLNIYSRKFNRYNWFDIYLNQESSEKQAEIEHSPIGLCSKTNES